MATYNRYIALGDSFTEGMCDEFVGSEYRGWADRLADVMASQTSGFTYANLAVRGQLIKQVMDDQIPLVAQYVTGPETLITFHAGANDVLRPNYKSEVALAQYRQAVQTLTATGATVAVFTVIEAVDGKGKTADLWTARFSDFNVNVRAVAKEFGAILIEAQMAPWLADRRFLAVDRLHLNKEGHIRMANALQELFDLPFDPAWRIPLPAAKKKSWLRKRYEGLRWLITFVIPWAWRRIRGRSSGDGRSPKFPVPVKWPIN